MRARRALLYTPGDDIYKIRKAAALDVDCVCLDMEDGVAANRKEQARQTISSALQELNFTHSERLARINPVGSGMEQDDLLAALVGRPDGIVIPKMEHGAHLRWASRQIAAYEQVQGLPTGSVALIAVVETALGIVNLPGIVNADPRLEALIFGAEDFAASIGATRTPAAGEVHYARSAVVTYTAAYGLQAIDMVYLNFHDTPGLLEEARLGAAMGFSGKQIIHPNQIQPVQQAFTPSEDAIAAALRLVEAYQQHQRSGRGAFALDEKMVDAPIIKAAEQVLARARAAHKLS
jgi:citrate lyase beta subunit